ncbi:MAG TPA: hypothetical protein VHL53_13895 [Acidimicrobiia bacterium]|nr:hypothetical protein [Acidimicrobiia bacterium]
MRVLVVAIFACIAAMIVTAPHSRSGQPVAHAKAYPTSLPTQDCMNSVAGADGYAPPIQDCLTSMP